LEAHGREWRRPVVEALKESYAEDDVNRDIQFSRGWVSEMYVMGITLELAHALVALPALRLLHRLHVTAWHREDRSRVDPPADSCLGNVRVFQIGFEPKYGGSSDDGGGPAVAFLAGAMPRLEKLLLFAREPQAEVLFALPNLTRLRLL